MQYPYSADAKLVTQHVVVLALAALELHGEVERGHPYRGGVDHHPHLLRVFAEPEDHRPLGLLEVRSAYGRATLRHKVHRLNEVEVCSACDTHYSDFDHAILFDAVELIRGELYYAPLRAALTLSSHG